MAGRSQMRWDDSVLSNTEIIIFALRALYQSCGYKRYRMRRFEEYELYSRNKDFLVSDQVIVFTDTNGKLMALKPDVTLSIIKNSRDDPESVRKLCYNESVYRVSERGGTFHEIMQTGIECFGRVDEKELTEVLCLAGETLSLLGKKTVLVLSDLDILQCFMDEICAFPEEKQRLLRCVGEKNLHEITSICDKRKVPAEKTERLRQLLSLYGQSEKVLPELEKLCAGTAAEETLKQMKTLISRLKERDGAIRTEIDFSLVSDSNYYNGIIFKGYLEGVPDRVLSGGRYDRLMEKMGKRAKAIGFAVYLDELERITIPEKSIEVAD
jgi:ATP phosphoribosyltransferase regulatory subunit